MDPTTTLGRATADEACRARHRADVPKNILVAAGKKRKLAYPISTTGVVQVGCQLLHHIGFTLLLYLFLSH